MTSFADEPEVIDAELFEMLRVTAGDLRVATAHLRAALGALEDAQSNVVTFTNGVRPR